MNLSLSALLFLSLLVYQVLALQPLRPPLRSQATSQATTDSPNEDKQQQNLYEIGRNDQDSATKGINSLCMYHRL